MEDLEMNPLHRAFLTRFKREYEIACKMSYVIAIPRSDTLDNYEIDQYFANSHILVPSKLLKMHYTTLQVGYFEDLEMDNRQLIGHLGKRRPIEKIVVNILDEEIGYNCFNKPYRTLLIDRPLLSFNNRPLIRSILAPLSLSPARPSASLLVRRSYLRSPRLLRTHDDCFKFLECISHQLTLHLEEDVKRLQSNYIILSHYLDDAAERTRRLADQYSSRYELALEERDYGLNLEFYDSIRRSIRLSVEAYIIHLLHGKLIVVFHSSYEREDQLLAGRFDELRQRRPDICQLGGQEIFSEFRPSDELLAELARLPSLQSPLAMVSSIIRSVDLIGELLSQSVKFKRLIGLSLGGGGGGARDQLVAETGGGGDHQLSGVGPPGNVPIVSDDYIASFVCSLVEARPSNLFSSIKYLEMFGWSATARDQAAYYTATFQAVVQYILSFSSSSSSMGDKDEADRGAVASLGPKP